MNCTMVPIENERVTLTLSATSLALIKIAISQTDETDGSYSYDKLLTKLSIALGAAANKGGEVVDLQEIIGITSALVDAELRWMPEDELTIDIGGEHEITIVSLGDGWYEMECPEAAWILILAMMCFAGGDNQELCESVSDMRRAATQEQLVEATAVMNSEFNCDDCYINFRKSPNDDFIG